MSGWDALENTAIQSLLDEADLPEPVRHCEWCGAREELVPPALFWYACRNCHPGTFTRQRGDKGAGGMANGSVAGVAPWAGQVRASVRVPAARLDTSAPQLTLVPDSPPPSELSSFLAATGRDADERVAICVEAGAAVPFHADRLCSVAEAAEIGPLSQDVNWYLSSQPLHPRVISGRGGIIDCIGLRTICADLDHKETGMRTPEAALAVVYDLTELFGTRAAALVASGHGTQPHWQVERGPGTDWADQYSPEHIEAVVLWKRFGRLCGLLAERHGGAVDTVSDLSRVWRIPGTINVKSSPVPVTAYYFKTSPVPLSRLRTVLDDHEIWELPSDRELPGDVVSPSASWKFATETCGYVQRMVSGWATDTSASSKGDGRHQWLTCQATRLASAWRMGCVDEELHDAAAEKLRTRFLEMLSSDGRTITYREVSAGLQWGIGKAESFTDAARCWKELGGTPHKHKMPPDDADSGDTPPLHLRDKLLTIQQIRELPPADPLIDELLYRHTLVQLSGPPGAYKTFIALGMACSLSTGVDFGNHPVGPPARVLYIAAEGANGLGPRADAWEEHTGNKLGDDNILFYPEPLQLGDDRQVQELCEVAVDPGFEVVFFDTRARCTEGLSENDATEQGKAIASAERIRRAAGGTAVVIHHSPLSGGHGRGSSAWDGGIWTDLRVVRDTDLESKLHVEKHKDVASGQDFTFDMIKVGETLVARESSGKRSGKDLSWDLINKPSTREILEIVRKLGGNEGLTRAQIVDFAVGQKIGKSTAYEGVNALVRGHLLHNVGSEKRPSYVVTSGTGAS